MSRIEQEKIKWPFFVQIPTLGFAAIILYWAALPHMPEGLFLEAASNLGFIVCFFECIPVGILGVGFSGAKSKRMDRLRIPARILGIINIVLGSAEIFITMLIFADIIQGIVN